MILKTINNLNKKILGTVRAGLSSMGKVDDWHKFWNFIEITGMINLY